MPQPGLSDPFKLSPRRRMELAEQLWLSVADEGTLGVPTEHKRILNQRLAGYKAGKSKILSHEEIMHRARSA